MIQSCLSYFIILLLLIGVNLRIIAQTSTEDTSSDNFEMFATEAERKLLATWDNPVMLDTLVNQLIAPQNVNVIATLKRQYVKNREHVYMGGGYHFRLYPHCDYLYEEAIPEEDETTFFYDGDIVIDFRDYAITCYSDSSIDCNDFGFQTCNTLSDEITIIEVCGHQFLYADLFFFCNGLGCGQRLNMIYDLKEKVPTFISNFRFGCEREEGDLCFLLSDFDNDGTPDLLIMGRTFPECVEKETSLYTYEMVLIAYSYERGHFRLKENAPYLKLKGVGDYIVDYYAAYDYPLSLIENKGFNH